MILARYRSSNIFTHRIKIVAFLLFAGAAVSDAQQANDYLESISAEFNTIQEKTWEYTRTTAHGKSARKVEKKRRDVVLSNKEAIRKIIRLKPFNGSSALRDSALSYLKVNYAVLNEDFAKLVDLEGIAEDSYDAMEAYMLAKELAYEKLHAAGIMIASVYSQFAAENNIPLTDRNDRLSKNMEKAGDVYSYFNELYLIFFKSYKQEAYFLEAMQKNDLNGMAQNRTALIRSTGEGLQKLGNMQPYQGDNNLLDACSRLVQFYKGEAEQHFMMVTQYFVSQSNFEKLKKNFETGTNTGRTTVETEEFNRSVAEFNRSSKNIQIQNATMNRQRETLLREWNKACDRFTDKHVPVR
jgi:hypothetical protein